MKRKSAEFTEALWFKAKQGDVSSAKVLLFLVEKRPEKADAKKDRPERSLAINLAAQPEWEGHEAREDVGVGSLAAAA
jgi:hypothetical protein